MAAAFPDAALPTAAPAPHASGRRRPRNYFSAGEYRKLFWAFMPPALVAVVAAELLLRPLWEPPPPPRERQVDTRLEAVTGPPPGEDAVVILPDDQPPETRDEDLLGASLAALTRVRDASFFGPSDRDAWLEMGLALKGYEGRRLPPPQDVGFTELFGQPRSFRGRAVRMRGTLHRLERLDAMANDYGIDHYWQGWLEPAGGPASPLVVHFMEVPEGMATGLEIVEPVVISGFFLKNMAYRAADGVRLAPLVLAREPVPPPPVSDAAGAGLWDRSLTALGVATMLAIVTAIGIGFLVAGRGRRRRPGATGLDSALVDVEPFSVAAALERVAAEEAVGGDDAVGGADR
jgi:hypothetical protein